MTPFLFYLSIGVWQLLIFGYIIQNWLDLAEAKKDLQDSMLALEREKERFRNGLILMPVNLEREVDLGNICEVRESKI